MRRRGERGRGERVVPGISRLRLPLPWSKVPHVNAWALAAGNGFVLVDCGMHLDGAMRELEHALDQVGLTLEQVSLLACTHAHLDHCGQAPLIQERAGCPLWLHPDHAHGTAVVDDPEAVLRRRAEIGRHSGVPAEAVQRWMEEQLEEGAGIAGPLRPDRELVPGVTIATDLGDWRVLHTPGHAPSHVCLHLPDRRLLISGDHLLGRVALYFDYGYTPDPIGEFLASLDLVEGLDARLALAGHGKPFTDMRGHVAANRALVAERLASVRGALADVPATAYAIAARVYGENFVPALRAWQLTKVLCYLRHLEVEGVVARLGGEPERWAVTAS
jgi:glyoxylase-like metal-dependent hydrolase (beta-lactamase superfamily II)